MKLRLICNKSMNMLNYIFIYDLTNTKHLIHSMWIIVLLYYVNLEWKINETLFYDNSLM